jgi:hypothetical protein
VDQQLLKIRGEIFPCENDYATDFNKDILDEAILPKDKALREIVKKS